MGGSSSSASSSKSDTIDRRLAVDGGVGVTGDGNSVSFTSNTVDAGAVAAGRDVALAGVFVGESSISKALDATMQSNRDSLAAANAATSAAINSANASLSQGLAANASVSRDAMSLVDRSQGVLAKSFADSLGYTSHVVDQAFAASDHTTSMVTDTLRDSVNQVARAYDTATNYQAEKATLDTRYLVVAGLAVVGLAAVKGFK